jgi:hypothetical protein
MGSTTIDYTITDADKAISSDMITITTSTGQKDPVSSVTLPTKSLRRTLSPKVPLLKRGLVLRLEGDIGVSTTVGVVNGWADQSGFGNHLSSTGNPTLHAGALNGHDIIRLDGSGDRLSRDLTWNALPSGNKAHSLFLVVRYVGMSVAPERALIPQSERVENEFIGWLSDVGRGWLIQAIVYDGMAKKYCKNGTTVSQDYFYRTDVRRSEGLIIGAELADNPHVDMDIATVLAYNHALSDADRQQVEAYLQNRYF